MRYKFPLYMFSSTSSTFSQHTPSDERYAAKNLVKKRGEREYREGKDDVDTCHRQLCLSFQYLSERCNYQIMNYIDAIA